MTTLKPGQPIDDVPHDVDFNLPVATKLASGVTLRTKDSTITGNAIIVKETVPSQMAKLGGLNEFLKETNQTLWLVETDFGNRMTLSTNEVLGMFELGFQQNYESWWNARIDRIAKTI